MAKTKRKRDLRVALLRKKYLKLKYDAEKIEQQKLTECRRSEQLGVKRFVNSRDKFFIYRKYAKNFVRKLKRFCYGIRELVGFEKKPILFDDIEKQKLKFF